MKTATQDQTDRAHEWTAERYPDATDEAGWCEDFGDLKEDIAARIRARSSP